MALQALSTNAFTTTNVGLQNNLVKVFFPLAIDKNDTLGTGKTITYMIRYSSEPLYCGGNSTENYLYKDNGNVKVKSGWTTLSNVIIENGMGVTIQKLPTFPTDVILRYEIAAAINYEGLLYSYIESPDFFAITNTLTRINPIVIDWGENNQIRLLGKIIDSGFSTPANYQSDSMKKGNHVISFNAWRSKLTEIFGNILFSYSFTWGVSPDAINDGTIIASKFNFRLNEKDWIYDDKIDVSIDNPLLPNGQHKYNPDKSYYFKYYLRKSGISSTSNSILNTGVDTTIGAILLPNIIPLFQILQTGVKANMPKSNKTKAGSIIAARGAMQLTDLTEKEASSIALYDYYIPLGQSDPVNKPSLGFYNTDNTIRSKIELGQYTDYMLGKTDILLFSTFNPKIGDISFGFHTDVNNEIFFRYDAESDTSIRIIDSNSIIDNLTTVNDSLPLSAKQGKFLQDNKVDKITGKGLSTEDFSTAFKTKLTNLPAEVYSKQESDINYIPRAIRTTSQNTFNNLNNIYNAGFYSCTSTTNSPSGSNSYGSLIVARGDGTLDSVSAPSKSDSTQIYHDSNNNMFIRTAIDKSANVWSEWEEVAKKPKVYEYNNGKLYLRREGRIVTGMILKDIYVSGDTTIASGIPNRFKPVVDTSGNGAVQVSMIRNQSTTQIQSWAAELFYNGGTGCYLTLTTMSVSRGGIYESVYFDGRRSGTLNQNIPFSYICVESES